MAKKEETISMIDTLAEFKELKNIDKDTMMIGMTINTYRYKSILK